MSNKAQDTDYLSLAKVIYIYAGKRHYLFCHNSIFYILFNILTICTFSWENRQQYVNAICQLRIKELLNEDRMQALRAGLATVLPLQVLMIMSPTDVEMRACGLPTVNIEFLKVHSHQ